MWLMLTVAVGAALFMLKYKVQDLENELVGKQQQIVRDQSAIRVLQAEWTYLNDPGRLRRLSEEYLNFHAATPQNVSAIDALPMRTNATPQIEAARAAPETHDQIAEPAFAPVAAPERPSVVSVAFARIQRLLLPSAAGAATLQEEAPK
jgi:hypothetical protein